MDESDKIRAEITEAFAAKGIKVNRLVIDPTAMGLEFRCTIEDGWCEVVASGRFSSFYGSARQKAFEAFAHKAATGRFTAEQRMRLGNLNSWCGYIPQDLEDAWHFRQAGLTEEMRKAIGRKYRMSTNLVVGYGVPPGGWDERTFPAQVFPTMQVIILRDVDGMPDHVRHYVARAATAYHIAHRQCSNGEAIGVGQVLDEVEHRLSKVKAGAEARSWLEEHGMAVQPPELVVYREEEEEKEAHA